MSLPHMPLRTVALIGAVCLTVGWLLASTLTPPVARVQTLPERQTKGTPIVEDAAFSEPLHLRLQQVPVAPTPRRNPFVFGERPRPAAVAAPTRPEDVAATTPAPSPPVAVGPVFSLAGIGISGATRTAILADGDAVHVLTVGERVGGYDIIEITDNSVTLGETSGLRWVLRLR